ncbi:RDD family protein [Clostridium bowmanii]|uniref:RDD family protein n=1 Tax=Clostridium bowmanii TaxID=132925 RepID=UPI001C0B7520|nr:RDD family protein [Clostridium bowmanii]MBU3191977.1 RDD family protein [Clostridium bowmanii]MCA1076210.1 RDD family protein [Clostridium bowmanii]
MQKIKITTPENIEVEYTLAGLGSRTGAVLIDMIIQGVMFLILGIALLLMGYFSPDFWKENYGWIIGGTLLLYALISYGYFIAMELSMNGMTIGKKFFRIRTIRNNGQPITLKHSALRNLFRVFIDVFGIGVVLIFLTKEHKRVGDFVASTIVVTEKNIARPITLEGLQRLNEHYRYLMSEEEYEVLREYAQRKHSMGDYSCLKEQLNKYFSKKFEAQVNSSEWDDFWEGL